MCSCYMVKKHFHKGIDIFVELPARKFSNLRSPDSWKSAIFGSFLHVARTKLRETTKLVLEKPLEFTLGGI